MLYDANRFHIVVLITWQFAIFFGTQLIFSIFAAYIPEWSCGDGNFGKDCEVFEKCGGIKNVTFSTVYFDSAVMEFDLICGEGPYKRQWFPQLQFFGILLGTVTFGTLSDAVGRKPVAILVLFAGISLNFISGLVSSWNQLIVVRFFLGLSAGGVMVAVYTYCMEMLLPQQRMMLRGFFNWGIGRILLTTICFFFPQWRYASFATAITALPALLLIVFVFPESPTWLHNKGRLNEMRQSEKRIAQIAGTDYVPVDHKDVVKSKSLYELLSSSGTLRKLSVLWCMWFVACICAYANDLNSNSLSGHLYVNQLLFGVIIYASKIILAFVDHTFPLFSRRLLHQGAQSIVCCCFLVMSIMAAAEYKGMGMLVLNLLGTVFIEYTWDACYLCATESNTTSCRASATGSCSLVARFGAIVAPSLLHLATIWSPAVFVAVVILGLINLIVSYLFLHETKGVDLDAVPEDDSTVPLNVEEIELRKTTN